MSIFETSTLGVSGVSAESSLGEAVSTRSNIFEMTQLAESTVLRPLECGMFPHDVPVFLYPELVYNSAHVQVCS